MKRPGHPATSTDVAPKLLATAAAIVLSIVAFGCRSAIEWTGITLFYEEARGDGIRVVENVPYWNGPNADEAKHRLDLYLPPSDGWPVLLFVHGGGWTEGDKGMEVAGADVYGNIGRFYASRGIGVGVINYRLQPSVSWREQVIDVARALAWTRRNIGQYGGDREAIFLSGHSAGGQLSAHVALNEAVQADFDLGPLPVCGVISLSGAAFDLADRLTYEIGGRERYFEERFRNGDRGETWRREASPVTYIRPDEVAPPFLLLFAEGEPESLHRQSRLFDARLSEAHIPSRVEMIPGESHTRMVLAMSHPEKPVAPLILEFIADASCRRTTATR